MSFVIPDLVSMLTYKILNDEFGMQISSTKGVILRHICIHVECLLILFCMSIVLAICVNCCFLMKLDIGEWIHFFMLFMVDRLNARGWAPEKCCYAYIFILLYSTIIIDHPNTQITKFYYSR